MRIAFTLDCDLLRHPSGDRTERHVPAAKTIDGAWTIGKRHARDPQPGARIVAHDFGIEGWPPLKTEKLPDLEYRGGGYKHEHVLYLWKIE